MTAPDGIDFVADSIIFWSAGDDLSRYSTTELAAAFARYPHCVALNGSAPFGQFSAMLAAEKAMQAINATTCKQGI